MHQDLISILHYCGMYLFMAVLHVNINRAMFKTHIEESPGMYSFCNTFCTRVWCWSWTHDVVGR